MNMRVLVCALNFAPEPIGAGRRTFETARRLARAGHKVRVVTAHPYYPEWRVAPGIRSRRYQKETIEGVRVFRCPLWVPRSPRAFSRLIHLLSFSLSAIPVLGAQVFWRPDVVIAVCPTLLSAPAALALARITRARAWLHVHDLELDAALSLGMLKEGWAASLARRLEAWLFRRFDGVFAVSQGMGSRLEQKGVLPGKVVFLPNGVDTNAFQPEFDPKALDLLRGEFGIPGDTVVALYSGSFGKKQGLLTLIQAAKGLAKDAGILFLLCGDGAEKKRLQEEAKGLANVRFLPIQPEERYRRLLCLADIYLVLQGQGVSFESMPSKLAPVLACGGAVLATAHPGTDLYDTVREAGGEICAPLDAPALARAVVRLSRDPVRRMVMGKRARAYALEHLDDEKIFHTLERMLPG